MGLGINREEREGAGRDAKECEGTQRNVEGHKGMRRDAKECEETQRNVEGRKERILN
jgi:hypothetical protein